MEVKAVLFDLDGTLIDTERIYRKVWPETIAHFGGHMSDGQYLALRSLGRPFSREKFAEWFPDIDYDEARAYRGGLFNAQVAAEGGIQAKPGAKKILQYLQERGILCAIATATDEERTRAFLTEAGLLPLINRICCATQVRQGKPSPELYLYTCEVLNLSPSQCLAVEDAPNGIRSAASAGLRVLFIPDQTEDEPEVADLIHARISSLTEVKEFITIRA